MSEQTVLAAYHRSGGRPPVDDERLEIRADGAFELWRTMGGPRVGAFAGHLSRDRRRRLAEAIDALETGTHPARRPAVRDSARESFQAGHHRLDVASGVAVHGPWSRFAHLVRRWSGALTDQPAGALGLMPGPGGERGLPVLAHLGWAPVRLWTDEIRVELFARDRDGVIRDRAARGVALEDMAGLGEPAVATPGWSMALPVERIPEVPAGGMLETWLLLPIERSTGRITVRLTARQPVDG